MKKPFKFATIEDEDGWQFFIHKKLQKDNLFEIMLKCKCGNDFFEKYNPEIKLDFVLLDINLPCIPGFEVAKRIKKEFPDLPIIVFTSSNNYSDRYDFASIGINYYISKNRFKYLQEDLMIIMGVGNSKYKIRYKLAPYHFLSFIDLICKEKTNKKIAETLNIKLRKVEYQQKTICDYFLLKNSKLALVDFARSYDIL